jgi:hypothetical protein
MKNELGGFQSFDCFIEKLGMQNAIKSLWFVWLEVAVLSLVPKGVELRFHAHSICGTSEGVTRDSQMCEFMVTFWLDFSPTKCMWLCAVKSFDEIYPEAAWQVCRPLAKHNTCPSR